MKRLLIHGKLYKSEADCLLIIDNKISKIGNLDVFNVDEMDEIIDCKGHFVLPGFNDSHMHLVGLGVFLSNAQLQHCTSLNNMMELIKKLSLSKKKGEWIIGRGWNQDNFDKPEYPTKKMLDDITKDHPIILTRCCGHIAVVNSKAIELSHVTQKTIVSGGEFDLETGLFKEMAIELINRAFPKTTVGDLKTYIQQGVDECHRNGITSVQSDDFVKITSDYHYPLQAYRELEKDGLLQLRVNQQCQFIERNDLELFIKEGHLNQTQGEFFKLGPIKVVGDGSLGARTARMSKPYHDDPTTRGMMNYMQEDFDYFVKKGMDTGMGTIVHTIGDGCLDAVLMSFEKYLDKDNKNRSGLVHVQITRSDQLEKIKNLHLHAYIQSCFLDYDSKIVKDRVGDMATTSYAFKTLYETTTISNGSDAPVEPVNCFTGIECAVTRSSIQCTESYRIEESLSLTQAIDSYTECGAYPSFEEDSKGKLREGMVADIILVDQNLLELKPEDIHKTKVLQTIFNGKTVFSELF